jgi:hypothetical protein
MVIEYLLFLVYLTRRKAVREEEMKTTDGKEFMRVHLIFANMSVGAKHDRSKYQITTNNLYTVMLRPLQN